MYITGRSAFSTVYVKLFIQCTLVKTQRLNIRIYSDRKPFIFTVMFILHVSKSVAWYQNYVHIKVCVERGYIKRIRWSRGSVLAFGTQVHGFKPGRSRRIFQGEKILSTPSFGGEVKPSVPCHRFTACKRFLNATWKSGISGKIHRPFLAHIVPPLATRISREVTSGESWNI